jgi:predicted kinase
VEAIVFCGLPATGKSSFYRERFFRTHVRINLDMLRTRHREHLLMRACLEGLQPFVVDNTNPTRSERERYIARARTAGFRVVGYYFASSAQDAIRRNAARPPDERVPIPAIYGKAKSLELPALDEGFAALYRVRLADGGGFTVEPWDGAPPRGPAPEGLADRAAP